MLILNCCVILIANCITFIVMILIMTAILCFLEIQHSIVSNHLFVPNYHKD